MNKQKMLVFECIECKAQMLIGTRTDGFRCYKCGSPIVPIRDATEQDTKTIRKVGSADVKGNKLSIGIDVNVNMQSYYDQLVLYRSSIDAQIKVLGESPSICTHKKTEETEDGIIVCANKFCNKVISVGIHDWVK